VKFVAIKSVLAINIQYRPAKKTFFSIFRLSTKLWLWEKC